MKEMKSETIQSKLNQSHIVDDFTSDYYETISSKIHMTNGSDFKSTNKLRHAISKLDMTPDKSVGKLGYGGAVKRVKVDLLSSKHRSGSIRTQTIDDYSQMNSSNIIDDFES